MPIVIINGSGGSFKPEKKLKNGEKAPEKKPGKCDYKPNLLVVYPEAEEEERLIKRMKSRPFDIKTHIKLAAYYRRVNNWPEAEHHEEIVEYLDRIRRYVKSR